MTGTFIKIGSTQYPVDTNDERSAAIEAMRAAGIEGALIYHERTVQDDDGVMSIEHADSGTFLFLPESEFAR